MIKGIIEAMEKDRTKGKSLAFWVKGYYLQRGGFSFDVKIPIFDYDRQNKDNNIIEKPTDDYKVLIDYLGSFMWINCKGKDVFLGYGNEHSPSKEGKLIQMNLERLRIS